MSIASEISRIQQAKADIKTAIEAKGVTVPSSANIDTYDDYVSQISGGGGSSSADTALKEIIDGSITSIDIPSGVTSIGTYAFADCDSLSNITIPDSVTTIGNNAFYQCHSFTSINIPSGVTSIGASAFRYCTALTSITINATTPPTLGSNTFANTNNCPIYVPSDSVDTYKSASGWSTYTSRIQAIPNS